MKSQLKNNIAGFTLIEMLVSMAVTMVLLYTVVQLFITATNSNTVVVQAADMTDNLRASLNLMEQDLQQTGSGIPTGGISYPFTPNGGGCATHAGVNRPVASVQGVAMITFPTCNSTIPAIEPGNENGPPITAPDASAGTVQNASSITDEITLMYQDNTLQLNNLQVNGTQCPHGSVTVSAGVPTVTFDTNCLNLSTSLSTLGITVNPGDLIMLQNANGNTLLTVTSVSLSGNSLTFGSGDPFDLNRTSETGGTLNQLATSGCTNGSNACFPGMTATRVWMISYYLDDWSAPPYVRLIRQVNFNGGTPVGETLENLQFTYNFVDGVTNPSNQATVPTGNSESQIRSVNVYLAARSSYQGHQGNTHNFARNNLMTQVSLRSMAYVNRYQ
jgi:prepilin-type N-terminal cleavage/methylation domain-containing protein